jgi:hypothetical protein
MVREVRLSRRILVQNVPKELYGAVIDLDHVERDGPVGVEIGSSVSAATSAARR